MTPKIILITGATDGIGKITARKLAEMGHHIIIHGRNTQKAERVVAELKHQTSNQQIDYLIADLFSLQSVYELATIFARKYSQLDVLINNAGAVLDDERIETVDGLERTMALNVVAPFLLTQLLLPSLAKSPSARIINMSSGTHRLARPQMTDLNLNNVPSGQRRYGISKLFVIWNTQHLAKVLQEQHLTTITVNVSHPGAVATNFGLDANNGFLNNLIYKTAYHLAHLLRQSPDRGAVTNVYLATSPEVSHITGKFFNNKKRQQRPAIHSYTPEREQQLWDYCMRVCQPFLTN